MSSKIGLPTILTVISVVAVLQASLVQDSNANDDNDVDGADFLVWQRNIGFSPSEKLELAVERVGRRRGQKFGSDVIFTIVVTNAGGGIVGQVQLGNIGSGGGRGKSGRSRGFGFVTMGSSAYGELTINDELFGQLTQNPRTGRVLLGLALFSSRPPRTGRSGPGATITIVDEDGLTKAGFSIVSDPGVGIRAPG